MKISGPLFRTDVLTGCGNLVSFADFIVQAFAAPLSEPVSILSLDVNSFGSLNQTLGPIHGDETLRWIGIVLLEEARERVYRTGGDEFVAAIQEGDLTAQLALAEHIYERLNRDSKQFRLQAPACTGLVIQYPAGTWLSPEEVFFHLGAAMVEEKNRASRRLQVFSPADFGPASDSFSSHWLGMMLNRLVSLGAMLDETQKLAYTDPLTGLPNQRAARAQLLIALEEAGAAGQPLAVLLIDGDDLKRYNMAGYAAGDEMIKNLGAVLRDGLRPGDFLARWRVGDEFLVLLPKTNREQALSVGNRLCKEVQEASESWLFPVTVSVGVAVFPALREPEADTESLLLHAAETANERAKREGKNQVVIS
jgi:diguanylate cyclase (GGDEF)-like protein